MRPGQLLVDMGCGDGRVLRKASNRYGVRAMGHELKLPWPGLLAWHLVADEQTNGNQYGSQNDNDDISAHIGYQPGYVIGEPGNTSDGRNCQDD